MAAPRNMIVSVIFRVTVCIAILATSLTVLWWLVSTKPKAGPSGLHDSAPRLAVMRAAAIPVRRQWEGFGTARALDAADVPARVTSTVVERPPEIDPGVSVKAGQLLIRLDESDFARQLEMATQTIEDIDAQLARLEVEEQSSRRRAELAAEDLKLAQAEYERVQRAVANQAANQRELDQARQALNAAQRSDVAAQENLQNFIPRRASLRAQRLAQEASRRLAAQNVERSRILSPIDGVLANVDVDLGESVMAGQRIGRVVNLESIEVPLLLPASARREVAIGDEAILASTGATVDRWKASVVRISPEDDESTRTMTTYVELRQRPSDEHLLAPGKFVHGQVVSRRPQNRWMVPVRAISSQRVMLIQDGLVHGLPVDVEFHVHASIPQSGLPDTEWAVLRDSLPDEALVVLDATRTIAEASPAIAVLAGDLASSGARAADGPSASTTP